MSDKVRHQLVLMPSGRQGTIDEGLTLLDAAAQLGVELESICGGRQTCGKCRVRPENHAEQLSLPTASEQAYADRHSLDLSQERLACATHILGDVRLQIPASSLARKQVILKGASALHVDIKPAVQIKYVEVAPATAGGPSDARRLRSALAEQWELHDLTLDLPVLRALPEALRAANGAVTVSIWREQAVIRIEAGYVESLYGLAVDLGSTTMAAHLCDLRSGDVLATKTLMNPQVRFGEDLVSRISFAREAQGTARLHHAVIQALNRLAAQAAQTAGIGSQEITDAVVVGNTVMQHLLLGVSPDELGHLPFALAVEDALDLQARDLGLKALHKGARVHILPCIAGYVGADNASVLLAEYASLDDGITLIVDIGTNAEILLCAGERILSASSPTGPAFEGAQILHGQRAAVGAIERVRVGADGRLRYKVIGDERWSDDLPDGESLAPTGICGSGIIEAVAECFAAGIISRDGRFQPGEQVRFKGKLGEIVLAGAKESATGEEILLTQHDVRAIQLAKAALYSGVRLLMDHLGVDHVDHIRLAGAFGSVINPFYAMSIGLIPDCDLDEVVAVGNAAGDGARMALLNVDERDAIQRLVAGIEYVETAAEADFQDYFVDALHLPHAIDLFPHLNKFRSVT